MVGIDNHLVSEELFQKKFVCDLSACKGACCVLGDSGAPLEEEELEILDDIYDEVKPFLSDEGIRALEAQGTFVIENDGSFSTPLIDGRECAYTVFENGVALCGIEKAWRTGAVAWKKPISCELYPIRVSKLHEGDALNYHAWHICKPACACGESMQIPVYKFLKAPIIRKYGEDFYQQMEAAGEYLKEGL